jgi:hypothetical protein
MPLLADAIANRFYLGVYLGVYLGISNGWHNLSHHCYLLLVPVNNGSMCSVDYRIHGGRLTANIDQSNDY